jgi:2-polyprenyl-3-methyl-5-hydroxy-6-metoxy-1,4-benzoquinol methylase
MASSDEDLIQQQITYYRRRAGEYDATAVIKEDPFGDQGRQLEEALDSFGPRGSVLEIAAGTGQWTQRLLDHADSVLAIDSSPEMIELNKAKVGSPKVAFVIADVFKWDDDRRFDVVFFGNWLSHVPPSRFELFWEIVAKHLVPDGRVFFVDEAQDAWRHEELSETPHVVIRTLEDGSVHRAVKLFWEPSDLEARLRALGWDMRVRSTGAFLWGEGTRSGSLTG